MTLTEDQINSIKNIALEFTQQTLGAQKPKGCCFHISYPLSLHLANIGIKNQLQEADVSNVRHFWIKLDYENGFVIDPTARQFGEDKYDYVHFGEPVATPDDCIYLEDTINLWEKPIVENVFQTSNFPGTQITHAPIEDFIQSGVKAAIFLLQDNKLNDVNSRFLEVIRKGAIKFYKEVENIPLFPNVECFKQYCLSN